ncbi:MAG: hypothetical protein KKB03_01765 [Nanoarchaeota archaeon]|nr:hypothetical protein [Nanoarchaeota archaeon]MBU1135183.1 hypothetical protein [Nanoarchaeota archaeon]MBU2519953.1 hypothetical protein [Nanoarchaeota archaeon]
MKKCHEMKEVGLWDLPEDKVYVKIKRSYRIAFFNYAIKTVGGVTKLANTLNIKSVRNLYSYKNAELFTPLRIIKKMLSLFSKHKKSYFIKNIEKNIEKIKTKNGSKPIKNPKLPIKNSPMLCGITGHIIGDGGIYNLNGTFIVHYSNNSQFLVNQFKKYILDVFGDIEIYEFYNKRKKAYRITVPSIIGLILSIFLRNQNGDSKHIPEMVLHSNKTYKAFFLRALFDDEGGMNGRAINIGMSNRNVIRKTKKMLEEFRIKPGKTNKRKLNKNFYNFNITGRHDLERFARGIGFNHPEKKEKLTVLLKNYKIDRYKKGEMEKVILGLLSKNIQMDIYEISKKIKRKPQHRIRKKLITMEKKNMIKSKTGKFYKKIYHLN